MERAWPRTRLPAFADRLPLGGSGLEVSPFCLGAVDDPRTVIAAFERGINFFFVTADMHWPEYEGTRRGLTELLRSRAGVREQIVIAGVSYVAHPDFVVAPFIEVIESVPGLERIDVAVVGGVGRFADVEAARRDGACRLCAAPLQRLVGVRATGASFHDRAAAASALADERLDLGLVRYNSDHDGAESEIFPAVRRDARTLLYCFKSVQGCLSPASFAALGLPRRAWMPTPADHYRFVLSAPEVDGILCAPEGEAQLDALGAAMAAGPLDEDERDYLKRLTRAHRRRRQRA